jgi:hypothetical protein
MADYYGVEDESNENNNIYYRSFIWSPYVLTMGSPVQRTDDPPADSQYWSGWYNAEGFSGTTGGPYWYAFAVMPVDAGDDFDVRLNTETPMNVPQQGFGSHVAWSGDGAGEIDFTIVDRNEVGSGTYYASILNFTGAGAGDKVVQFEGDQGTLPGLGTYGPFTMAAGDLIDLHEISFSTGVGEYRVHVQVTAGSADYGLSVYDTEGGFFSKDQTLVGAYADNAGPYEDEYVVFTPTANSFHGIAVWKAHAADRNASLTYNLIVTQSPNLTDATPAGWYGPVVPRNTTDATSGSVPLPATLTGNATTTSFNFCTFNEGANSAVAPWETRLYVDDFFSWYGPRNSDLASSTFSMWLNTAQGYDPYSLVRGGRHHLRIQADALGQVAEVFEADNDYTEWFVWTPLELDDHTPLTREAPPLKNPLGYGPYYSTDGYRTVPTGEWWTAVGAIPRISADDYDVRMYAASTGSKDGFGANVAWSSAVAGAVDFTMVNFNVALYANHDYGILNYNDGGGDVVIERANSVTHGTYAGGEYWIGPNTIAPDGILDVWEIGVDTPAVGVPVWVSLDNLAGGANLGIAVFDAAGDYYSRFDNIGDADVAGNGGDEHLAPITFPIAGWYSIVVYKNGSADLPKTATYRIALSTVDMVGAPSIEAPPARLALAPPRPNPFRNETRFRFDVPVDASHVAVNVFDLSGRRISTLVDGALPAGRHTAIWNGRDGSGNRVASGVYFVRMQSGDFEQTRKVTIVK